MDSIHIDNHILMIQIHYSYFTFNMFNSSILDTQRKGYFSQEEIEECDAFKIAKRRNEWAASRFAGKRLINLVHFDNTLNLTDIHIRKESSGQPYIWIDGMGRLAGKFSLSHSHGRVFCGYSASPDVVFGLDIEMVERKSPEFVQDYFTSSELKLFNETNWQYQPEYATLIWSAKEACLKAIGKGLSLDTRKVEIIRLFENSSHHNWQECEVSISIEYCEQFKILWQICGDFLSTICLPKTQPITFGEVFLD